MVTQAKKKGLDIILMVLKKYITSLHKIDIYRNL